MPKAGSASGRIIRMSWTVEGTRCRASDSFRFTRWDQDSLRSGIQTHPGIDETASSRWPFHARIDTAAGSDGNGTSDQMVGGSNPSGRAIVLSRDM